MSTQVSPPPEAGPLPISTNWWEITFDGYDCCDYPWNEDDFLDWLQSGIDVSHKPKKQRAKVLVIK